MSTYNMLPLSVSVVFNFRGNSQTVYATDVTTVSLNVLLAAKPRRDVT